MTHWLTTNWFSLIQSAGIIAGLFTSAWVLRRDGEGRKLNGLLALQQQHRELWTEMHRRRDLRRVIDPKADPIARPPTVAEERFLNLAIIHFETGWQMAQHGIANDLETIRCDAGGFFQLPLPAAVWAASKRRRNPEFVTFIDKAIRSA